MSWHFLMFNQTQVTQPISMLRAWGSLVPVTGLFGKTVMTVFSNAKTPRHCLVNQFHVFWTFDQAFKVNITGSSPNSEGWVCCLNVSVKGYLGSVGFWGLIRNSSGHGILDILMAELLALLFVLQLAWNRNCEDVLCVSDSLYTISLVQNIAKASSFIAAIL